MDRFAYPLEAYSLGEGCAPGTFVNPPVSQAQARFMRAVASGRTRRKTSLTPEQAREFVEGYPTKGLPKRARPRKPPGRRR